MSSGILQDDSDKYASLSSRIAALEAREANASATPNSNAIGNPAPLGLLGFAVVTWLNGLLKIYGLPSASADGQLAGTGIFLGGVAQVLAGLLNYARGAAHGATVFSFFGLHWASQGTLMLLRARGDLPAAPDRAAALSYYALLAASTAVLWVPTFRMNRVLNATLLLVVALFVLDAAAAYAGRGVEVAAGVVGCAAGTAAFYMCLLDLVNEYWGRNVLPLWRVDRHSHDFRDLRWLEKVHMHKSPL